MNIKNQTNLPQERILSDCRGQEARDVVERFCEHTARHPQAPAVKLDGHIWSYAQLDTVSDRMALQLQALGVTAESFVALFLPRSFQQILAILAVLKAGGAYVPIDPDYPEERVRMMIDDSGARVLMVGASGPRPPVGSGVSVIVVDGGDPPYPAALSNTPARLAGPGNAAYMIYTSGSTGRPKGVVVTRHNMNRLFKTTEAYFDFGPEDVWGQFHSYGFDVSVWEFWGALAHGGCLTIIPWDVARSSPDLHSLLRRERVTVLCQTPSAFYNLLRVEEAAGPQRLGDLRYVIFAGEALDAQRLRPWFDRYGDRRPRLVNMYGPTEATVYATFRALSQKDGEQPTSFIGRPLPDLDIHLVAAGGRLVDQGEPGEIWIAGEGVARGYHNRPELTAERFVADPLSASRRAYRSGDLARRSADGDLEYLGRLDAQVKIRGYRIELGEIEATLRQVPGVVDAVVDARAGADGLQLVAYVVPAAAGAPRFADLHTFLLQRLPSYMACHRFFWIDQIPLTIHGKVDRRALPEPTRRRTELAAPYVPPRTDLERRLVNIYSQVTGIEAVGIQDDFFALGGTSLLATKLSSLIAREFAVSISLKDIFTRPTVSSLAEEIRRGKALPHSPARLTIPLAPKSEHMPLTHAQERVWLIQKLSPSSVAYTLSASLRFRGTLNVAALRKALTGLVARHEVLRTTFPQVAQQPVQRLHPQGPLQLEEVSLAGWDLPGAEQEVERFRAAAAQRAFDLERLPLIEWTLFQLSEEDHLLLHREHHLLHDGWSFFVLLRDFLELYQAAHENRPARLPDLPVQIADFAAAQRHWVETGLFEDQLKFWREALRNAPALLALPSDHPRPSETSYQGEALRFRLAEDLILLVRERALAEGVTFYMVMLAPFVALLWHMTGQTDICIGTGVANRRTPESEQIVGMVINNVVLRFDLRERGTVRQLLGQVKAVVLAALENQDVPFDVVVRTLQWPQQSAIHPLGQVFFTSYDGPEPEEHLPDLQVTTELGLSSSSAKFDMNVILISQRDQRRKETGTDSAAGERVTVIWEYSTDLFERATVQHLVDRYLHVLRQMLAHPDRSLDEIRWTTEEEERWLREMALGPARDYPREASIQELFARQAIARPRHVAVIDGPERLSYRELDQRADRLARRLQEHGLTGEGVVGILLERGAPAVTAMLGILKAGAAYLPLNPLDPPGRLSALIAEAGAAAIVTRKDLAGRLPVIGRPLVLLEEIQDAESGPDAVEAPMPVAGGGSSLACVLFTSGSTGHPKGVEVRHRGVVRLLFGQDYARLGPQERVLQLAPLTFDASTFEIWAALLHGGTLIIFPQDIPDLERLERVMDEQRITLLWLNGSLFNLVMDERPGLLRPVRQLLIGGEALSVVHVRRAQALLPEIRIVNGYGPTENTTFSCCYPIPNPLPEDLSSIPIGRPLANSSAYVLDDHLRFTAPGVSGEIFLGGDGVARGYRGRPELTAERFLPDPFAPQAGGLLYRSGDLGAILPDGTIQFRGRRDDQMKIRGFRIEPGEVEHVLGKVPGVRTGAVVAQPHPWRGQRLVAFVVPADPLLDTATLRDSLRRQLPGHMVPDEFILLDELPRTPHGKTDRKALTNTVPGAAAAKDHFRSSPATILESRVLGVFQEILGRREIGLHDNFFTSGGHSLLAIRLIGRLNEQLSLNIDLRRLYRNPTVAGLCAALNEVQDGLPPAVESEYLLPMGEAGSGRPVFFVAGGDGGPLTMEVYRGLANYVPDRPFWGLCSTRSDGSGRMLQPDVKRLAKEFVKEIKRIQPQGAYDLAGECIGGIMAYEVARQLLALGDRVRRLVLLDTRFPNRRQYLRALLRGLCARLRHHLYRVLSFRRDEPGRVGKRIYGFVSGLLPFTEWEAARQFDPLFIVFFKRILRYRAKPYGGQVHLILSQQMTGGGLEADWGRVARGGLSVIPVPGNHESYIRTHIDETAIAFRDILADPD